MLRHFYHPSPRRAVNLAPEPKTDGEHKLTPKTAALLDRVKRGECVILGKPSPKNPNKILWFRFALNESFVTVGWTWAPSVEAAGVKIIETGMHDEKTGERSFRIAEA